MQTFLTSEKIAVILPILFGKGMEGGKGWMKEQQMEEKMRRDVLIDNMFLVNYF